MTADQFIAAAEAKIGCPYQWDGKGQSVIDATGAGVPVYDCSGLVTCSIYECGGPDWRNSHTAALLERDLPAVATPAPGDLCFYGLGSADHVMIYVDDVMGEVLGACGGGHTTTTLAIAQKQQARVRFRPTLRYRSDLRGFARPNFDPA